MKALTKEKPKFRAVVEPSHQMTADEAASAIYGLTAEELVYNITHNVGGMFDRLMEIQKGVAG